MANSRPLFPLTETAYAICSCRTPSHLTPTMTNNMPVPRLLMCAVIAAASFVAHCADEAGASWSATQRHFAELASASSSLVPSVPVYFTVNSPPPQLTTVPWTPEELAPVYERRHPRITAQEIMPLASRKPAYDAVDSFSFLLD